ncbi:sulfatase [Rhodohalobacter sulfatireducens]|uniref:Sulfatase n=1 Tax=Rhodohalobacter sulfatireducens TaxID=2911366 RepID=A0ABS9KJD3_9BACT|nr:sulfatase [Rhodohalobacter sulfatireducens]MCG2590939.1 sulfatase [Rhodohalobacter sulfatireducens]
MKRSARRSIYFSLILLVNLLLIGAGCTQQNNFKYIQPNIILIGADDLGYGGVSSFGNPGYETPNIDQLAEEGLKFTSFYANSAVCTPTRAALLTGRYQQRSGLEGVIYVRGETRQTGLAQKEITIAELLKKAGYRTGIMGKWHLGYREEFNPVHQGFDQFYGFVSGNIDYHSHYDNSGIFDWWHNADTLREEGYTTDLITEHSIDFIEENQDQPFFLYVPHEAPHVPFQGRSDPAYRFSDNEFTYYGPVEDRHRAYADMMTALDESVGRIIEKVEEVGIKEKTLVLFISDNGGLAEYGSNEPLRGSKTTLWEGGIRVPGIAWWPDNIEPGETNQPVIAMDFLPTFLGLARAEKPDTLHLDGINLSPLLFNGDDLPERNLFWRYRGQKAVRSGDWKLMISESDTLLFNLEEDISEERDLSGQYPERVNRLTSAIENWEEDVMSGVTLKTD